MIIAVDTNILVDILNRDKEYFEVSSKYLYGAFRKGSLIISEIVYAELASLFKQRAKLDQFLSDFGIMLKSSNERVLWEAGQVWSEYTARRDGKIQCPHCGIKLIIRCKKCLSTITCRQHIMGDFLIGAHARVLADCIFTRDRGYYQTYFKDVPLFSD